MPRAKERFNRPRCRQRESACNNVKALDRSSVRGLERSRGPEETAVAHGLCVALRGSLAILCPEGMLEGSVT